MKGLNRALVSVIFDVLGFFSLGHKRVFALKAVYTIILVFCAVFISACSTTLDADVIPVSGFESDRYLGQWYEIARIENRFEKGLSDVTANYSMREDGGIKVLNKGYNSKKNKWKEAVGKAYFVDNKNKGHLKVSFFGPIYGPYVVFELDQNYQYSFVTNHNKKYLWLLSRTPTINESVKQKFLNRINRMGFETEELIWVQQSRN